MLPPTVLARRAAYRVAYYGLGVWWFVRRPHTQGVKIVVVRGDEALFIRHTYGNRRVWEFPGGGIRRGEEPRDAAVRELREEVGLAGAAWQPIGIVESRDYANADLHGFLVEHDGGELRLDLGELATAQWASIARPPEPLGKHAAAFLALPAVAARAGGIPDGDAV